jgi:hypothetical protein
MTPAETERMKRLCKRIQEEQDQQKCNKLVSELEPLLAGKERRLHPEPYKAESNNP